MQAPTEAIFLGIEETKKKGILYLHLPNLNK